MKTRCQILIFLLLTTQSVLGQFRHLTIAADSITMSGTIISTNVDSIRLGDIFRNYGETAWHLVGKDQKVFRNSSDVTTFHQLYIENSDPENSHTKTFNGNFEVTSKLHLIDGVVEIPAGRAFLLSNREVVNEDLLNDKSYVDGMLQIAMGGSNSATFPVGNNGTYTPVLLSSIAGDNPIVGVDANNTSVENIGSVVAKPETVDDFSNNWAWEVGSFGGTLNSVRIEFPFTTEDEGQFDDEEDYKPVVLYQDRSGNTSSLDNARGDNASKTDLTIESEVLSNEGYYFAGTILLTKPIVHNVITPNGDSNNDYLVIENLELYPENKVTILDRYGVEIYATKDYVSPASAVSIDGEDFTFLAPGNYICILKYSDKGDEKTLKQTISVIK